MASRQWIALLCLLGGGLWACGPGESGDPGGADGPGPGAEAGVEGAPRGEPAAAPAYRYVGAEACAGCHPGETEAWRGSHHDRAMEVANAETVLGDFGNTELEHFGQQTKFFKRGEEFWVRTDGPDGDPAEYAIAFTFGIEPLQQYLVELPDGRGRLQALPWAWDTERGRWFHLHPDEPVGHEDVLHWTGPAQNWNFMCADCHSTALDKNYDLAADRYATEWAEIDVGCEACHGPGSVHAADPTRPPPVQVAEPRQWVFDEGAPIARREPAAASPPSQLQLDVCAPCHARRSVIGQALPGEPFLDGYRPALLDEGLYFPDGQIQDEVYVWGSFLQSRMHAAGVQCSDCHDPHGLAIEPPDAACGRCHQPAAFATPEHHHHAEGSAGASCVGCHMPARTYMVVDDRRDHSFRVPRPDLSVALGTPNACRDCHADWSDERLAEVVDGWRGGAAPRPHFAPALAAGRAHTPDAGAGLVTLVADPEQPAIVRATAMRLLRGQGGAAGADAVARGLADPEPLVRLAALEGAELLPPERGVPLARPLLEDPVRAVRVEAARVLVGAPRTGWSPASRTALADALAEYREAQRLSEDRPEAHVNLGGLQAQFGNLEAAAAEYETALRLGPFFVPAYVNLADLRRQQGAEAEAERLLRRALEIAPESADVHHALGLALVRQQRLDEALPQLQRAAVLAPASARYAYVYGVALHTAGDTPLALSVLADAQARHPEDRAILLALATLSRDAGVRDAALAHARRLLALAPDDPNARRLVSELEASPAAPR